jgi:hypothetical protein
MTRWVLADYGEVISDPMPAETILELADLAGMQADEFRDRYWKFRPPMTCGCRSLRCEHASQPAIRCAPLS